MKNLVIFLIFSFIAIYFGFFAFDKNDMFYFYGNSIYYVISLIFFIWLYLIIKTILQNKDKVLNFINYHKFALILTAVLVVLFFFICPPEYRIIADETDLLGTSKALYENRNAFMVTEEISFFDDNQVLHSFLDKRPVLFPYCLQIIHCFLGYSPNNAFILNALMAFGCIFLLYYLIQRLWGKFLGYISILLFAAYPLFIQYSMSAGFDIFNVFFTLLAFATFCYFYRYNTVQNANLLLYTVALLANTRYECSIMAILIVPVVMLVLNKEEVKRISYMLIIYPLLFIPMAWLMLLTTSNKHLEIGENENAFSFEFLKENTFKAMYFFSGLESNTETVFIIAITAVIALFIIIRNCLTNKEYMISKIKDYKYHLIVSLLFFLTVYVIKFSYMLGDITKILAFRHGLIFLPYIIFLSVYFVKNIINKFPDSKPIILLIILFVFFTHWPNVHKSFIQKSPISYKILKVMKDTLEERFPNKGSYILALDRPVYLAPFNYNVISIDKLNQNYKDIINYINIKKLWNKLVIIQFKINNEVGEGSVINETLNTETLIEKAVNKNLTISFSVYKQ